MQDQGLRSTAARYLQREASGKPGVQGQCIVGLIMSEVGEDSCTLAVVTTECFDYGHGHRQS